MATRAPLSFKTKATSSVLSAVLTVTISAPSFSAPK
jgi:hypothetical protein